MAWNPFRKKKSEPESVDPLRLSLSDLKPGYVLDYDLKTWQVTAHHTYDFDGDRIDEWELSSADEVRYLEREDDDGITWTLSQKIRLSDIDGSLRTQLRNEEDPPEEVTCRGVTYYGESSSVGKFYQNGESPPRELIAWDYLDDTEKNTLSIEQWGDDEFEVSIGEIVEDYQFSSILPSA